MKPEKIKLIINPAAGRGSALQALDRAAKLLRAKDVVFDLEHTRGPGDATRIAAETARNSGRSYKVIVAVGGDGTVSETAAGMVHSGMPLGIVPAGSGNDFVKALNIPRNVEKAVEVLLREKTRVIDTGRVNGAMFVNGVGFGFDAAVNRNSCRVAGRGFLRYLSALFRTLSTYRPVMLKVSMNDSVIEDRFFLLTVGNGTTFGGGFRLTPKAAVDDGFLDVTLIKPLGIPRLMWHLPKVFLGTIARAKKHATLARTAKLTVACSAPVPVHVDGEIHAGEEARFEIEVVPDSLTMIGNWS